jgi:ABC-type dipeptide/oligopeptide/nickel transport system permease component
MGLDDPFDVRYVNYVAGLVKGDIGNVGLEDFEESSIREDTV